MHENRKFTPPLGRTLCNELEARRGDFSLTGILDQACALKLLCTRFYALRNVFPNVTPNPLEFERTGISSVRPNRYLGAVLRQKAHSSRIARFAEL